MVMEMAARTRNINTRNPMSICFRSTKMSLTADAGSAAIASHRYLMLLISRLIRKNSKAASIHEAVMYNAANAW